MTSTGSGCSGDPSGGGLVRTTGPCGTRSMINGKGGFPNRCRGFTAGARTSPGHCGSLGNRGL